MTPPPEAPPHQSPLARLRPYTGLIALLVLCAVFGYFSRGHRFLSTDNFFTILNTVAIVGVLAVGQAFPLIGGGFDLSQGAVASLTGVLVGTALDRAGVPVPVAVAVGLTAGLLLGSVNGLLVALVGINPFVATLGTQISFSGLALVYTANRPVALGPHKEQFQDLFFGQLGPFTHATLIFLGLIVLLAFVLRMLPFGLHVYTLGGNEEATRLAGVNTTRVKIATYALSGLLAGLAGMLMIARTGQASPTEGTGLELQSLASCIIGGIALGGGVGGAWNVLLGAITLEVINNGLIMVPGVQSNVRYVIQGAIILLAVAVDARARLRRQ